MEGPGSVSYFPPPVDKMRAILKAFPRNDALRSLTLIALVPRLLAAIFSQGYFAHDDHFLVVEAAQSWADGHDYNYWLPWNQGPDARPTGHSFFYVGVHYLLFELLNTIHLDAPQGRMFVVRLLHALWSLVVVRAGYRIALRLSANERTAWNAGLFLALFYFMPFLAVRQLVEVACIPLLMLGAEHLLALAGPPGTTANRTGARAHVPRPALYAGICLGLAINVRFQTIFFAAGPGLLLLLRNPRAVLGYAVGLALPLVLIQGGIDAFLWKRPFAEITEYVRYNFANPTTYGELPWYNYLLLLLAVFIPPLGVAVFFGYWIQWRRHLLVWSAVFVFLAAHSWFPNKQERFILPIVPLFFVIGWCGWERWRAGSAWWSSHPTLWSRTLAFTWALNTLLLLPLLFSYSKRSRCEAFLALRDAPWARGVIVEDSHGHDPPQAPLFYWGNWQAGLVYVADTTEDVRATLARWEPDRRPNVVMFIGDEDLDRRVRAQSRQLGTLKPMGDASPGLLDRIVHWLNPVNRNETIHVYRVVEGDP